MSILNSGNYKSNNLNPLSNFSNSAAAKASEVVFEVQKKKVTIKKSKIKAIALGLAEIAYSLGETNDIDDFADDMADNIFEALKKVRQKKQSSKQQ